MNRTMRKLSETSCFQGFSCLLHRNVKTVLMAGSHFHMFLLRTADDLIRILHAHGNGFLNDTVYTMVNTVQSNLCVDAALSGNTHQFRLYFLNHFFIVCISGNRTVFFQSVLCQQCFHLFRNHIAYRCKFQLVVHNRLHMIRCNTAASDQCIFHFYNTSIFSLFFKFFMTFFVSKMALACCCTNS